MALVVGDVVASVSVPVRRRTIPLELKMLVFLGVSLTLGFIVIYPFVLLFINSFVITSPPQDAVYGLDAWRFALNDKGMLQALWNSVLVTVVRQGVSFPIAILFAWLIARTDLPAAKWLEFMFWLAFFLPVVPVTQAWILLAHPTAGLLNATLELLPFVDQGPFNIFSFWGIIWVHLLTNSISVKVMLLSPVFRNMDASLEDASRISGAGSLRTLWRVTVPVMTPAMATLLLVSVLRAVQSVEIELLLGLRFNFFVFGSKIFNLVRTEPPEFGAATAMGILVLGAVIPLILIHRWATVRRRFTTISGKYDANIQHLRQWRWPAFAMVFSVGMMMTVVPAIFLLMGTFMKFSGFFYGVPGGPWTLLHWQRILNDDVFLLSVKNTLYVALGSATISVIFFTLVAYIIVRMRSRLRIVLDMFTWMPYVMPGIVLALAWLWIVLQTPFLRPLYGTVFVLILVSSVSGLTLGVQIIKSNILQMGGELEEASSVTGASWFRTFTKVVMPLLAPTMVVIWVLNFVAAAGTAIIPAMLATAASRPLALLQLEQVMSSRLEEGSIVGVVVVLLTVGVAIIARTFGFRVGMR